MSQLRDVMRSEMGPWAFWKAFGGLWLRARRAGRQYLSWEEWDRAIELAEEHGIFEYYRGGRDYNPRKGDEIRAEDLVHQTAGPMLIMVFRRVKKARATGMSPWQFALEEDRRIDAERAELAAIHLRELVRSRAARASADKDRRARLPRGGRRAQDLSDPEGSGDELPLPE